MALKTLKCNLLTPLHFKGLNIGIVGLTSAAREHSYAFRKCQKL